jgi:hypothetical protein
MPGEKLEHAEGRAAFVVQRFGAHGLSILVLLHDAGEPDGEIVREAAGGTRFEGIGTRAGGCAYHAGQLVPLNRLP